MITILGKAQSINVAKVLWLCDELTLTFTREDLGAGFRSVEDASFKALNPNAMVPVLVEDDFVLWESNSILRYLANSRKAEKLYPSEARARATVDKWMDWQASDLNGAWRYAVMALLRKAPAFSDCTAIATSISQWTQYMQVLEQQLQQTTAFVVGPDFTLADIPIGVSVQRWFMTPFARPSLPAVEAYYQRLQMRPAFYRRCVQDMA